MRYGDGAVQWMTAGRGMLHEEMWDVDEGSDAELYQLWVNLPARLKMTSPHARYLPPETFPSTHIPGGRVRVLAGSAHGCTSPVDVKVPVTFLDYTLEAGASVTISARRQDQLNPLIADWDAGNAIAADATDPEAVRAMVAEAAEQMGGLDLVVYVAGFGFLQPLAETDPDGWVDVFRVNVVGANLVAGAALDHLDPDGIVAFISSRTVEDNNAFFAPYSATKAALDQCIRAWRAEHPDRRFIRVVMGNAQPTEFANHMGDMEILGRALPRWIEQGINVGHMMETTDVGRALVDAFAVALDRPAVDSSELKFDARIPPTETEA